MIGARRNYGGPGGMNPILLFGLILLGFDINHADGVNGAESAQTALAECAVAF